MNRYLICIVLFWGLFGCGETNTTNVLVTFNKPISLNAQKLQFKKLLVRPAYLTVLQDSLLLLGDPFNVPYYSVFNMRSGELLRTFGKQGNGPNEYLFGGPIVEIPDKNDQFECYEMNKKRIVRYYVDSLLHNPLYNGEKPDTSATAIQGMIIDYTYLAQGKVASGALQNGEFVFLPMTGSAEYFGDFPVKEKHKYLSHFQQATAYQSKIVANPKLSLFANVILDSGVAEVYEFDSSQFKKKKGLYFSYPELSEIPKDPTESVMFSKLSQRKFSFAYGTEKYIYILYSERTFEKYKEDFSLCEHLLVYDWDLNPIQYYKLDIPISNLCVKDNNMYGIANTPEPEIVIYSLTGL